MVAKIVTIKLLGKLNFIVVNFRQLFARRVYLILNEIDFDLLIKQGVV